MNVVDPQISAATFKSKCGTSFNAIIKGQDLCMQVI